MNSFEIHEPFSCIAIDTMGPIAATMRDNKHIIVAIDMFTKFMEAQAVPEISGPRFADFLTNFCGRFGIPKSMLTDNGTTFCNSMVSEVNKALGVKHLKSTPHHSRGNAVAERAIQSLQEKLGLIINTNQTNPDWDIALPVAVLSLNTATHKSTGYSPFELLFGTRPPVLSEFISKQPTVHDWYAQCIRNKIEELKIDTVTNIDTAQAASKTHFEKRHKAAEFSVGALVMIKAPGRRAKLADRYIGPFEITTRNKDIYRMRSLETGQEFTRHVGHLKKYTGTKDPTLREVLNKQPTTTALQVLLVMQIASTVLFAPIHFKKEAPVVFRKGGMEFGGKEH